MYDGPSRALELLTLGGGLPTGYGAGVPALEAYGKVIRESLGRHFPDPPRLITEPGRYLPAEAGMMRSEAVLVTPSPRRRGRW
ncbi:ornithine decarboxylase [Streptomyces auratus]|uniref:Ornithine decarboxylase n=1 Tax=Streptomyces auratus AGR0001 TaxID=1160718 RepID=J2JU78_9ACTN|nr:ornithine decarboxylase [Streptomyces auratus]QTZ90081.1 hypothetical protein SU9_000295 [Streptomyces auratus AGR0001]